MPKRESTPAGAPCWIELMTSDPAASKAFYGDLFGWTSEEAGPDYGNYISFYKDGTMVAGGMANDPAQGVPDGWSVYLATDDAAATAEAATAEGGTIVVPTMAVGEMGTMVVVTDPSGAAIGAWQPGTHKGFGLVDEPGAPAWFELHTRDHAAAVAFYEKVFGWDTQAVSDTDDFRYTTLGEGDDQAAGIMDASKLPARGRAVPVVDLLPHRRRRRHHRQGGRARRHGGRAGGGHAVRPARRPERPDRGVLQADRLTA